MNDAGTTPFTRPRFFEGRMVTARDFVDEQTYHRDQRHALAGLLHGYGTVCGLRVEANDPPDAAVTVGPGIALDASGRMIVVPEPTRVELAKRSRAVVVGVEYAEHEVQPMPAPAASGCGETIEASAITEGFRAVVSEDVDQPDPGVVAELREAIDHGALRALLCRLVTDPCTGRPRHDVVPLARIDAGTGPVTSGMIDNSSVRPLVLSGKLMAALATALAAQARHAPG